MAKNNLVSIQIPTEDQDAIRGALTLLGEKLQPYLIALTLAEKRGIPKMRDKTTPFVEKAVEYAENNPTLVPGFVDVSEMKIDFQAMALLTEFYRNVEKLYQTLNDTILLCGSETYKSALQFYKSVQQAAKSGVPGAQVIYDDLKQRFERSSTTTTTPTEG
ncbi:MAG: hypothetical protein KKD28_15840 [Chloroflexi bacterium]|nr:hypothetical protein [Chloroflexota bacterium]